jgi:hypothetical protein
VVVRVLALAALVSLSAGAPRAGAGGFTVVSSVSTSGSAIDTAKLKGVLTGQTAWPDGTTPILVQLPKGDPAMAWMAEELLGMPEKLYRRQLLERVFRGSTARPHEVDSAAEAMEFLLNTKGAAGPVPAYGLPGGLTTHSD